MKKILLILAVCALAAISVRAQRMVGVDAEGDGIPALSPHVRQAIMKLEKL